MTISASDIRSMSSTAAARYLSPEVVDHQQAIADGGIDTPLRCATSWRNSRKRVLTFR